MRTACGLRSGRRRGADRYLPDSAIHFGEDSDRPFFLVTSIVMAVLVVIFAGGGIHALIEGDLIEGTYLSSVQLTIGSACIRTSKRLRRR